MDVVILLLIIFGLAWYLYRKFNNTHEKPAQFQVIDQPVEGPIVKARRTIKAAIDQCNNEHGPAMQALLWLAATDGTISKQEARNIFRFCEQQGSVLPPGTYDAIEYLNAGVELTSSRADDLVRKDLHELAGKSNRYKIEFIGVAHAICGSNKRVSKAKQAFLDTAKGLIT